MEKLSYAAFLIEDTQFPIFEFAEWYLDEGIYLDEEQIDLVFEGFWGSTLKGATTGGVAGGVAGGGLGAIPGAIAGGLLGAGKHIWNQARSSESIDNQNALKVLVSLKNKSNDAVFKKTVDNLIHYMSNLQPAHDIKDPNNIIGRLNQHQAQNPQQPYKQPQDENKPDVTGTLNQWQQQQQPQQQAPQQPNYTPSYNPYRKNKVT